MKKICLLSGLLVLITSFLSTAQTIRFTDTTNKWSVSKWVAPDGEPYAVRESYRARDTFFDNNGLHYTIIDRNEQTPQRVMFIREDTATRKIFVIPVNWDFLRLNVYDTSEFLYMDFSMEIGDTLVMPVVLQDDTDDSVSVHVVQDIDSQLIGTQWYKRMRMEVLSGMSMPWASGSNFYDITEGIGPYSGPVIEPYNNGNEYGPYRLSCFSNNGVIPYPFSGNCFDIVGITDRYMTNKDFVLYPNPADGFVSIRLFTSVKRLSFEIMDVTGKMILKQPISGSTSQIDVASLRKGIYIVRLLEDNIITARSKLVIR